MRKTVTVIVTILLALVFLMAGGAKLSGNAGMVANFKRWGYPAWFHLAIGAAEVGAAILIVIPRTTWLGGLAIIGIMLGAIYTHAILEPKAGAVVLCVVLAGLALFAGLERRPKKTPDSGLQTPD